MTKSETFSSNPETQPDQYGHILQSFHPNYEPKTAQQDVARREDAASDETLETTAREHTRLTSDVDMAVRSLVSDVEGAARSHTEHQPAPTRLEGQPSVPVLPYVLQDFRDKALVGLGKYQTMLRTNNGRDALADAYQEAVDKVMYLKQLLMEQDIRDGKDAFWLVDADIALEETWWKQREEQEKLGKQLETVRGEAATHSRAAYYWQDRYTRIQEDIQVVLKMLRRVALQKYEETALLDLLLEMYKKYSQE